MKRDLLSAETFRQTSLCQYFLKFCKVLGDADYSLKNCFILLWN